MSRLERRAGSAILAALIVVGLMPGAALAVTLVAVDDPTNAIVEDVTTTLDVLENDLGNSPLIVDKTDGSLGAVTITSAGTRLSYNPTANATGNDSFTYTISDGTDTATATVTVQIGAVNDPPVAVNDPTNPIVEDVTTTLNPLANDSNPENDPLTITGTSGVSLGAVTITSAGTRLSYNPTANATGNDSFTYTISDGTDTATATVTVQIGAVNDPPVAVNDPTNPIVEDVTTTLNPLANDSDPENDPLTITGTSGVSLGAVTITSAGTRLSYNPTANATGNDSFTYTISDGTDTATATVTVQIGAVNDPPVAVNDPTNPIVEDVTTTLNPLANDSDPENDPLTITGTSGVSLGAVTITSAGTRLSYNPTANATGNDSFTYTISDGTDTATATVTVQIGAVNDPPVAVNDPTNPIVEDVTTTLNPLANDSDPENDPLTITGTSGVSLGAVTITSAGTRLSYNPTANATGNDSFTYTISDGTDTATATVTVQIGAVNDRPDAVDDSNVPITLNAPATPILVLANDSDVEGDSLLITAKTDGTQGTVAITGGGTGLTYHPYTGHLGADSFTYTISDGHGGSDTASVSVLITGDNRLPNAVADVGFSVPEGAGATSLAVLDNDDDPDGDPLVIITRTSPAHGVVTITGGGSGLTYDPASLFHGSDSFQYTISDGKGGSDTATVVVTVTKDSAAPIVVAPVQRLLGQTVGTSSIKVRLSWSASDVGSGIKSYPAPGERQWRHVHHGRAGQPHPELRRSRPDHRCLLSLSRPRHGQGRQRQWLALLDDVQAAGVPGDVEQRDLHGQLVHVQDDERPGRCGALRRRNGPHGHLRQHRLRPRPRGHPLCQQWLRRHLRRRRPRDPAEPACVEHPVSPARLHPPLHDPGRAHHRGPSGRHRTRGRGRLPRPALRRSRGCGTVPTWPCRARSCYTTGALSGRP